MSKSYYEIGKDFFLIRSEEKEFHRNIYLKRFIGSDGSRVNMLFDSGTKLDVPYLLDILKELIGGIQNLHILFLSHQDPDVSSNANTILMSAPKAILITSVDTWRFVKMYGIPEDRFYSVESFKSDILKIKKTGHRIQFVSAKFCHAAGAVMMYDFESRILFSGDFLAGLDTKTEEGIYATEESWRGISMFHQIYMPSNKALKDTINRIGLIEPTPEMIAPQHGDIVKSDVMGDFLQRLGNLNVGLDLISKEDPEKELLVSALNKFGDTLKEKYEDIYQILLKSMTKTGNFTTPFIITNGVVVGVNVLARDAIVYLWDMMKREIPEDKLDEIKAIFINILDEHNIIIPDEILEKPQIEQDIFGDVKKDDIDIKDIFG